MTSSRPVGVYLAIFLVCNSTCKTDPPPIYKSKKQFFLTCYYKKNMLVALDAYTRPRDRSWPNISCPFYDSNVQKPDFSFSLSVWVAAFGDVLNARPGNQNQQSSRDRIFSPDGRSAMVILAQWRVRAREHRRHRVVRTGAVGRQATYRGVRA